jgi:hypothetical protein
LKYSNWSDLLWRLNPCKQLCSGSKGLDIKFSIVKSPHISYAVRILTWPCSLIRTHICAAHNRILIQWFHTFTLELLHKLSFRAILLDFTTDFVNDYILVLFKYKSVLFLAYFLLKATPYFTFSWLFYYLRQAASRSVTS